MKKLSLAFLALAACTPAGVTSNTARLSANADAQHAGVYAYAVEGDVVTLFDKDGIEFGRVAVTAPAADRRVFNIELADGTLDDAEVYRPMADGTFSAPVTPETALTATLADPALAPTWTAHQVRFTVNMFPRFDRAVSPSVVANINTCSTPSSDTPAGCARPANTSVGCTNPSQLPAVMRYNNANLAASGMSGYSLSACQGAIGPNTCVSVFGGTTADYTLADGTLSCVWYDPDTSYMPYCKVGTSGNQWTASCPRSTCGTVGQYDAVPRLRDCNQPGSCTKSQGTVGCTPYH